MKIHKRENLLKKKQQESEAKRRKEAKHELETVHKEKQKITNELQEKIVKKAKVKEKCL